MATIEFTDTDISVIPKQGISINGQDAMITTNDIYAAQAEAYFGIDILNTGIGYNYYSYIDMSNAGGSDEGIVVRASSYYSVI